MTPQPAGPSLVINPATVRAYDVRGVYGRELRTEDARQLGLAYAHAARSAGRRCIAVGRDGRLSSPELEQALIEGLVGGGLQVLRIGLGPTPQLYYAVHSLGLDGGIMVTGSHNPRDENGFKLLWGAGPIHGGALHRLLATPGSHAPGGSVCERPISRDYVAALMSGLALKPRTVIWDCGHGATAAVIRPLTAGLPGRHYLLNARVDGRFPGHHPDPSVAANLRELQVAVITHGADLGIAFDGDGDRIGVVDGAGSIVWPDQLLVLLARDLLQQRPGARVVADVKSGRVLFDEIGRLGGEARLAPSGYVRIRDAMLACGAPLGGEMSGHILYADCWHGTDDALWVALRVLRALDNAGESLATFRHALPSMAATPELRIPCPEAARERVLAEVMDRMRSSGVRIDTTDGLRVERPCGWWLMRASGTEARLTIRCEATDADGLAALIAELEVQLAASGLPVRLGTRSSSGLRPAALPA